MFSVFSVLFLCNQVFGVLYSGPFKSDGSNLPPGAVTQNYTSSGVTINSILNVVAGVNTSQQRLTGTAGRGLLLSTFEVSGAADAGVMINAQSTTTPALAFGISGAEAFRLYSTGQFLGGGYDTPRSGLGPISNSPGFQLESASNPFGASMSIAANIDNNFGPEFWFVKTNSTANVGVSLVNDEAVLGSVYFGGGDGSGISTGARIRAQVSGTPGAGDMPTSIVFSTTPDGANTVSDIMWVASSGNVGIGTSSPTTLLSVNGVASFGVGTSSLPSIAAFGDLDTGAWFPAADTFAVSTGGSERLRVTSAGYLLIGTTGTRFVDVSVMGSGGGNVIQTLQETTGVTGFGSISNGANSRGSLFSLGKSRGTVVGSVTSVISGDVLGAISFNGADGTGLINGATIMAAVDGTPGTNDMPGRLIFSTTADGAATPTERMRITSMGNVGIGTILPHASAILDVQSTTKGLRLPNMTAAQMYAIVSPAAGLMIWNTSSVNVSVYTGSAWANVKDL